MAAISTMQAIIVDGGTASLVPAHPLPELRDTYILVKVHCVALNPTDWKHVSLRLTGPHSMLGCDYAGTVVKVGSKVTKAFSPGDRICGCAHGGNFDEAFDGVFAEYAMVKGNLQIRIPENLSFEQACTLPLGLVTVGQGLYQKSLKLNLPTNPANGDEWVLIYGGSSATGSLGIQFAKMSGYKVITTASSHNHEFVKELGADAVFDYNDPECGQKIREFTDNGLRLCWDTISVNDSGKVCAAALSSSSPPEKRGKYGILQAVELPRDDVEVTRTLMYTIFNETFHHQGGKEFPASREDFEFAKMFTEMTEKLLHDGKIRTHPEHVGDGGLAGVLKGMQDMKNGKVSRQKLVYRIADKPARSSDDSRIDL